MPDTGEGPDRDAINAQLRNWRQGDCVIGGESFIHRFRKKAPITPDSKSVDDEEADIVESEVRGLAIVTQTCDLIRDCIDRPFVEVVPLVEVDPAQFGDVKARKYPKYAHISGVEKDSLVADLDRVMTVEKAVVANWGRVKGCATDEEIRLFADALSRKRSRFAFPDDFVSFLKKLQRRIQDKHERESDEGRALRSLIEIRVRAAPSWNAQQVDLMFWFVRREETPDFEDTSWSDLLKKWMALITSSGRFGPVNGVVAPYEDMTALDLVESDRLDLDYVSRE